MIGYFANGTEGEMYHEQYCSRCIHESGERRCAVWTAHLMRNYSECNNEDSILHILIPRKEIGNGECRMFVATEQVK